MLKIENPTDADVSIVIEGHDYMVPANESIIMDRDEHVLHWKRVHGFLIVREVEKVAPVIEKPIEVVEEAPAKKIITKKAKK